MNIFKAISNQVGRKFRAWAASDDRWYGSAFSWLPAWSGQKVTELSAMQQSTFFACEGLIERTISTLPIELLERTDLGKQPARSHSLYSVLHDAPNQNMTSCEWVSLLVRLVILRGNSYNMIVRSNRGNISGLIPMRNDKMEVMMNDSGTVFYRYEHEPGRKQDFPKEQILHMHDLSVNGLTGTSVLEHARNAIGLGMATEKFGSSFFKNGARPSVVLEYPGKLTDTAIGGIKESFVKDLGGDGNLGVKVLKEGMKLNTYSVAPNDAQFLETRKFQVEEMARMFNVPLSLIQYLHAAFKSNVEQENIGFVVHSIRPRIVRIEQALNMQLLTKAERERYYFKFNVNALLRGDALSQAQALEIATRNGITSINEWRSFMDWNPILDIDGKLDPAGDQRYRQNIWTPVTTEQYTPPAPTAPTAPTESKSVRTRETRANGVASRNRLRVQFEPTLRDMAKRIMKIEVNDIRNAINKHLNKRGLSDFRSWLDGFYDKFEGKVQTIMAPTIQGYGGAVADVASNEVGGESISADAISDYTKGYVGFAAARHVGSSRGQLNKIITDTDPDNIETELLRRLDEWDETRAEKITMREKVEASDTFARMAWMAAGVTTMVWLAQGSDPCPFCEEMNGNTVGIQQAFVPAGGDVSPEGQEPMQIRENTMHAPLHQGCECTVVPG